MRGMRECRSAGQTSARNPHPLLQTNEVLQAEALWAATEAVIDFLGLRRFLGLGFSPLEPSLPPKAVEMGDWKCMWYKYVCFERSLKLEPEWREKQEKPTIFTLPYTSTGKEKSTPYSPYYTHGISQL